MSTTTLVDELAKVLHTHDCGCQDYRSADEDGFYADQAQAVLDSCLVVSVKEHAGYIKANQKLAAERDEARAALERVRELTVSTDGDPLDPDDFCNSVGDIRRTIEGGDIR